MVDKSIPLEPGQLTKENDVGSLVATARRDPKAFGQLYALYVQPVFRYLYSRIGSLPEAEDATAQTFLAAFEGFTRYRHDGYFASWLFTIARHKAMDHFRQRRRLTSIDAAESIPAETDLLQQVIQTERVTYLAQCIKTLPEEDQELIRLRYLADLSFAEMGHLLGRKQDAVKKALYRLLARLQDQLEETAHV